MNPKSLLALLPLLATLPLSALSHPTSLPNGPHSNIKSIQRKTLNFGPSHPHAFFKTVPAEADIQDLTVWVMGQSVRPEPRDLAFVFLDREFAKQGKTIGEGNDVDFFIRNDSYTDPRTSITHVYARQLLNGLEVADGDINVNIYTDPTTGKFRVLSWGNSFYQGDVPSLDGEGFMGVRQKSSKTTAKSKQCAALEKITGEHGEAYEALLNRLIELKGSSHKPKGGVANVLYEGIKIAGEVVFGLAPSVTGKPEIGSDSAVLDKDLEGLTIDQIEDMLLKMEHQSKNMRDHVDVICAPEIVTKDKDQATSFGGEDRTFVSPTEALSHLMTFLNPASDSPAPLAEHLSAHPAHSSFAPESQPAWAEPPPQIIKGLHTAGPNAVENGEAKARLMYHQVDSEGGNGTEVRLVWRFEVQMRDNWYDASVDVETMKVVSVVDWASDAPPSRIKAIKDARATKAMKGGDKQKPQKPSPKNPESVTPGYRVFPWGINDPSLGNHTFVTSPEDSIASPAGWHAFPDSANLWLGSKIDGVSTGNVHNSSLGASGAGGKKPVSWTNTTTTISNNVFAQENFEGQSSWLNNWRPVNKSLAFDYEYGEYDGLRPKEYIDASVTQLFYTCNMYHDYLYRLGFDEISGNFQMENWGLGGMGGDAVIAQAQDGSGTDNANMMTPPDGSMPRMRMYVWDTHTPYLDGDFEAGIVLHEYTHGLSTRLTGGPANSGCLSFGEGGGMGEGWGDCFATLIRQIEEHHANESYPMGAWAANNNGKGIRNYPYTANITTNPSTYKFLDKPSYFGVHSAGEVYAEVFFVLNALLIEDHGFSKTLWPPINTTAPNDFYRNGTVIPQHGNTLSAQLLVTSMKLQPCRPTFVDNRNALLQADQILTGGENACTIWKAFASRGLGTEANLKVSFPWGGGIREEGYSLPKECSKHQK